MIGYKTFIHGYSLYCNSIIGKPGDAAVNYDRYLVCSVSFDTFSK